MGRTGRLGLLFALLVSVILSAAAFSAASAKADPVTFTFNEGRINLGDLQGLAVIDPSADPPDAPATLSGDVDEFGQFTAQPEGFSFPDKTLENIPVEAIPGVVLNLNIVAHFSAGGEIDGIYDRETGDFSLDNFPLNASFSIYVAPATSGTPLAQCAINDIPVPLNTSTDLVDNTDPENPITYAGAPFTPSGAAATTWESLPPVEGGGVCDLAAGMLGGPGGLWLSGPSTGFVVPAPALEPQITSAPEAETASTSASFSFEAGAGEGPIVSGYECRVDGGPFEACTSPKPYTEIAVGSHTFEVRATNASGEGPAASHEWTVIGTPLAPVINSGPETGTTDTEAQFTFAQNGAETQPVIGFECRLDAESYAPCSSPKDYSELIPGNHTFRVRAKTIGGTGLSTQYQWTIEGIVLPPTTMPELDGPPAQTADTTAQFSFEPGDGETQEVTGFECKLDDGAFEACSSPKSYSGLLAGDHTVQVRSTNEAGEGPPATSTWKVVAVPSQAPKVTGGPDAETDSTSAEFTFAAGDGETQPITGFECSLGGEPFEACTSPKSYSGLGLGEQSFEVRAVSIAGHGPAMNVEWTIVSAPVEAPDVTGKPDATTTATNAEFAFAAGAGETQDVTGFQCKLDSGAFEACSSPKSYSGLAVGNHTFAVKAVNDFGSGPESTFSWTVQAAATAPVKAPDVTGKPDATTTATNAEFAFAAGAGETQDVTGFQCKLDSGAFEACSSPKSYSGLAVGNHTFAVKAVNSVGSGPESSYAWTVKSQVQPGKPALGGLVIKPKAKAVKRGKKAVITVKVKNVGKAAANGAKVCVKAPAKLVTVKKCVKLGSIAAGKAKPAKFKVKVKKKAKKGKKAVLKFTATANGVAKKTGKATIKVK